MNPEAYMTATRQAAARANKWSLENLQLSVRVLSEDAADSINCNSQTFVVRGKSPMFTPTAECPV